LTNYAYMFEAKGIQRYIFVSGKLRDVVGASELVAGLASSDSGEADEIGSFWSEQASFSRRAGGAFCIHSEDKNALVLLRAKWRHYILTNLPGLEFVDVIAKAKPDAAKPETHFELEAMRQCFRDAGGIRSNYPSDVPGLGRPISKIAPLTGRPAATEKPYGKYDEKDIVFIDAIVWPQRKHADEYKSERIAMRFVEEAVKWKFPRNYDEKYDVGEKAETDLDKNPLFPFVGEDKRIAIIHADLSGLGDLFRTMGSVQGFTVVENFKLAKDIEDSISRAVKTAVAEFILPAAIDSVLPARPILLGGDDITIIVRADLAIPFTAQLLKNIEKECSHIGSADNHSALSACAGIAIVGKGTPFLTAYALADDLCLHAKKKVKADIGLVADETGRNGFASAYSFHVCQHSAHDAYDGAIAENDIDATSKALSANPYIVGGRATKMQVDLLALAQALVNIEGGHNRVREIKSLISDNLELAKTAWDRWREVAGKKHIDPKSKSPFETLEGVKGVNPFLAEPSGIFDAMTLIDLGAVSKQESKKLVEAVT
jgi:hypothetical protein